MKLVGQIVIHNTYGQGIVQALDESDIVSIAFVSASGMKKFPLESFLKYLHCEDWSMQQEIIRYLDQKNGENEQEIRKIISSRHSAYAEPKHSRILFCNIAYMQYYDLGNGEGRPSTGGAYVLETGDAHERMNFHVFDDAMCYGYTETKGHRDRDGKDVRHSIHIEKIDPVAAGQD